MQNIAANTTPNMEPDTQGAFRLVRNERMAGTVPSYGGASNSSYISGFKDQGPDYSNSIIAPKDDFTFKDLVDMVNPLQHIPVVNMIYREITGDEIKPASKIVGSAVFGGPVGAASSLVNLVIEEETGEDLAGNALSAIGVKDKPQKHNRELQRQIYDDLPVALLGFAQTPLPDIAETIEPSRNKSFEMVKLAQGRTAGSIPRYFA